MTSKEYHTIGKETPRKDGVARVTGQEMYTSDVTLPHMLHGRILRSPHPHALIRRIDTSAAEAMGAVCLTFEDIPHVRYNERIVTIPEKLLKDRYVLPDKVRHVGEAVAAVAAPTEALAEKAMRAIKVEYELLDAVFDPFLAMDPAAPQLYDSVERGEERVPVKNNVAFAYSYEAGDPDGAFAGADAIVEGTYSTPGIYHVQFETRCAVCRPEPDGGITLWATTQSIHNVRQVIGELYDIPLSRVNVKKLAVGGAFGSSIQMNTVIPITVALALKARRPVKLVPTREEDAYDHRKYPTNITLKLGATRDGRLVAGEMKLVTNVGAHNTQAHAFVPVCAGWWVSLYRLPNLRYDGVAMYTNNVPSCAMQGYGNPQVTFAVESTMDELATRLGIDPVAFRLKNYVGLGETFWGQGPTVQSIIRSCGVEELLERGKALIGWDRRVRPEEQTGRYRRGIGVGRGFHTTGAGGPRPGDVIDYSSAFIKINEDGSVDVVTAVMDHGGGTLEAIAKIVAEELGVPLDKVGLSPVDTRTTTYDVVTHATRGVYAGGGAAHKVAKQVKQKLLQVAGRILDVEPEGLQIRPDDEIGQGVIFAAGIPGKEITIREVAKTAWKKNWGTIAAVDSLRQVACPPAFVAHFIEVEVDTETGAIKVVKAVAGSDAGTVINPDLARGQLEGGLSKGIGFALCEDAVLDDVTGCLWSDGFLTDMKIPTSCEMPPVGEIKTFFAHTSEPTGPLGAKGIGEAALNPVPAAVANAVCNALGIRFYHLPITREKVVMALAERKLALTGTQAEPDTEPEMVAAGEAG